jgi:hypothetical protein
MEEDRSVRHPIVRHDSSDSSTLNQELLRGNPVERRRAPGAGPSQPIDEDSLGVPHQHIVPDATSLEAG